MSEAKCVLMAIKPKFAQAIIKGDKTIELRKTVPKIASDDLILFYETVPVKSVSFFCRVNGIIAQEPKVLWERYRHQLSITKEEYDAYFLGRSMAYGINLGRPHVFVERKCIQDIDEDLVVPQSYIYVPSEALKKVLKWEVLD